MADKSSDEYIVDTILPCGEIHLLGGPTGAGKSRWLFDTLLAWEAGKPVLGFKSYPSKWVYVSCDRSSASVARTLRTMDIDPARIPLVAAKDDGLSLGQILKASVEYKAKLVVIESFGSFVESPNGNDVRKFFYKLEPFLRKSGAAILGVMESPKMKVKEVYQNPRQRISGAASWGHYSETIILIEPIIPDIKNSPRRITVCPRNSSEMYLRAVFEAGHLVVKGEYTDADGDDMPSFT